MSLGKVLQQLSPLPGCSTARCHHLPAADIDHTVCSESHCLDTICKGFPVCSAEGQEHWALPAPSPCWSGPPCPGTTRPGTSPGLSWTRGQSPLWKCWPECDMASVGNTTRQALEFICFSDTLEVWLEHRSFTQSHCPASCGTSLPVWPCWKNKMSARTMLITGHLTAGQAGANPRTQSYQPVGICLVFSVFLSY